MYVSVSDIISDVRVVLDQNTTDGALLSFDEEDTLRLNELIRSKIADGIRSILSIAPLQYLDNISTITSPDNTLHITTRQMSSGYYMYKIILPYTVGRLIRFKLSSWRGGCHTFIDPSSHKYVQQQSPFVGIHGNPSKPVCALIDNYIEAYSAQTSTDFVDEMLYITMPVDITEDTHDVSIPEQCLRSVIYYTAGLVALIGKDTSPAELFAYAKSLIGIHTQ